MRGGEDDGGAGFDILESLHVAATDVAFVGGDAADVIGERTAGRGARRDRRGACATHEVGVQVVQRGAHNGCVFLVHAKDDGLGEAIGFFEEIGEVASDGLRAGAQSDEALEIGGAIFLVGDGAAIAVEVILARPPAGRVPLGDDAMDAVRREEAVVNALAQAVGINRVAEVEVGIAVLIAQGSGGHAQLIGRLEIFEDFAPVRVFLGAAAMALVHDNEIEEIRREFFVQAGAVGIFGDGLVSGEIEFAAEDGDAALDLVARVAEGREDFVLGIVHQKIAIGQVQNSGLSVRIAFGIPF